MLALALLLTAAEPPQKADLMVVVAHPDDESTFGGLIPYYAKCRGKSVVFVCLTSGEWGHGLPHHTSADQTPDYSYDDSEQPRFPKVPEDALYPCYYRETELANMLRESGVMRPAVTPRFADRSGLQPWGKPDAAFELWGGREKVVGFLVERMRRHRPEVVVTMAADGYNGNPQHMAAGTAAVLAAEAAGDADEYPGELPPWAPKKVYRVLSKGETAEARHVHSWEFDCGGETARAVAARANAMHESQGMKAECPSESAFVLVLSQVGPDTVGRDDLFENVSSE